ncbi:myoblast fusion [Homalodisca vitripennis]|nr:myoblast fusion [Homalodisca vitripennis]
MYGSWILTDVLYYVAVSGQLQYFRVQPKDVKVHEGGEVTLQCEVANRAGFVQWTKDGFALVARKLTTQIIIHTCKYKWRWVCINYHYEPKNAFLIRSGWRHINMTRINWGKRPKLAV